VVTEHHPGYMHVLGDVTTHFGEKSCI
jgi:hypothetical protein